MEKRERYLRKLERVLWESEHHPSGEPTHRLGLLGFCGAVVNSRDYYTEKILKLNTEINAEQKKERKRSSTAFVTFKTLKTQALASQALYSSSFLRFQVQPAPEPRDIIWHNIGLFTYVKVLGRLAVLGILAVLMIFWSAPVVFIASLTTLSNLITLLPFLGFLADSPGVQGFLEGFLPTLSLSLFMTALPYLLRALIFFDFLPTHSAAERSVLSKHFFFLFVNVFLIVSVSGTIFNALDEIIHSPASMVESLARSLPLVSVFFSNYIFFWATVAVPLELVRWGFPLLQWGWLACFARTEREKRRVYKLDWFQYDFYCATMLLVFVIALTYSTIFPVILPIAAFFFLVCHFVFSYQCCFAYPQRYESEGKIWPYIHNRIIWGLLVFQLTTVGIFGLKGDVMPSTLAAPLPFFTLIFAWYIHQKYSRNLVSLPLDLAMSLDDAEQEAPTVHRDPFHFHNPALRVGPVDVPSADGMGPPIELHPQHRRDGSYEDDDNDVPLVLRVPSMPGEEEDQEILLPNRKGKANDDEFGPTEPTFIQMDSSY